MGNVRTTIEHGLQAVDAVRAFTVWPSEILGVRESTRIDRSWQDSKLDCDAWRLFDRNSRVTHVFIDGRPADLRPAAGGGPVLS